MCQVKDEQPMVVRFIARYPDTIATRSSRYVVAIDADMDLSASDTDQTGILGCTLVHICNVSICRIGSLSQWISAGLIGSEQLRYTYGEEGEEAEEGIGCVVVLEHISSCTQLEQEPVDEQCRGMHRWRNCGFIPLCAPWIPFYRKDLRT